MRPPRITIVTPSFNQGEYLERTVRSVLDSGYPDLEYMVVDGGSTDGSVEIIRRHAERLAWWVSEPDGGQYDALNKGFARATGEVMGWLNSDDLHAPWALSVVGQIFAEFPQVRWLTSTFPLHWDAAGRAVFCKSVEGFGRGSFFRGENVPRPGAVASDFIQQESTFWRRSLWDQAGGRLDASLSMAGDLELWARFFRHADLCGVCTPLGGFRIHAGQKTDRMQEYVAEAMRVLERHDGRPYTAVGTLVRRLLRRYVPKRLRQAFSGGEAVQICVHRAGSWRFETRCRMG